MSRPIRVGPVAVSCGEKRLKRILHIIPFRMTSSARRSDVYCII
jgi:hypothetical protein